ncbi:hypothetical protein COJ85_02065 [Bacillus sp. AFS076308]|uniref:hypothetical protein n=1 Tax=unclassified Bacillus (in: firmicutes) TaxID=185979 RepID=UPI000BF9EA3F|nr:MULTISPECIES: hypothetical protein [unclassified Bacillus (in: firmicutes)]PFO09414.1 hypothetical protein COJ85_02065 [Bacillus sp. AFS076308]PGV50392.1 hypothetical protein COD92_18650 [Bacillus sp. AFS037270]
MKKTPSLLVFFIFLLVVTACGGPFTSTSSDLYVVKKAHSKDDNEAWIIAYDPNSITEKKEIKILVQELMVWNLIEVNKTYFSSYSKKGDNPWILDKIEHLGDNETIR